MAITLTPAHKKSISELLVDDSPESITKVSLSVALSWGVFDGVDDTDISEEGCETLLASQRFLTDLEEAVIAGVKDGSIGARFHTLKAPKMSKKSLEQLSPEVRSLVDAD